MDNSRTSCVLRLESALTKGTATPRVSSTHYRRVRVSPLCFDFATLSLFQKFKGVSTVGKLSPHTPRLLSLRSQASAARSLSVSLPRALGPFLETSCAILTGRERHWLRRRHVVALACRALREARPGALAPPRLRRRPARAVPPRLETRRIF